MLGADDGPLPDQVGALAIVKSKKQDAVRRATFVARLIAPMSAGILDRRRRFSSTTGFSGDILPTYCTIETRAKSAPRPSCRT
jgi:hypothetical protein